MKMFLLAALLATSGAAFAQQGAQERHLDCSKAKDPKACEERVAKAKGMHRDARAACEGKTGAEHQDCMVKQMCAESRDAAKCEAAGKERIARREKIREACKDKRGEDLKACIRDNRSPK